jgi:hypothetical protein
VLGGSVLIPRAGYLLEWVHHSVAVRSLSVSAPVSAHGTAWGEASSSVL